MLEKEEQGKETSIQGLQNDLSRHEVTKKKPNCTIKYSYGGYEL